MKNETDPDLFAPTGDVRADIVDGSSSAEAADRVAKDEVLAAEVRAIQREGTVPPYVPEEGKKEYFVIGGESAPSDREVHAPAPQSPKTTDDLHRNGVPRWETAGVSRAEWERALRESDRRIAEVRPGTTEFVKLMEARGAMCFPPPAGVVLGDVDETARERFREVVAEKYSARLRRPPSSARRAAVAGVAALVALVLVWWLIRDDAHPPAPARAAPSAAASERELVTAVAPVVHADAPPIASVTVAPSASPSARPSAIHRPPLAPPPSATSPSATSAAPAPQRSAPPSPSAPPGWEIVF